MSLEYDIISKRANICLDSDTISKLEKNALKLT